MGPPATETTMTNDPSAFQSFRDDHRVVLDRLNALEGVLQARAGGGARPIDERSIRALVTHLEAQFGTHMRDEDELLFPALAESLPETAGGLAPLRAEHAELRQMLAALGSMLDRAASAARDEQIVVQLRDFVDLLRIHVHKEEAAVFNVAARVLQPNEILALSERIAARRARRTGAIPRRHDS